MSTLLSESYQIVPIFAQRTCTIPVAVFALGACSVYDSSLLTANQGVGEAMGGVAGARAGAGGDAGTSTGGVGQGGGDSGASDGGLGGGGATSGSMGGVTAASGAGGSGGSSVAGGAAGSGGSAGSGGTAGSGGALAGLTLDLIDDMEDDDASILFSGTRNGDWYAGHDATATGTQFPGLKFEMSTLDKSDSRYAVSKFAAMTRGMGFSDWGEDMGFNMTLVNASLGKHPPYDASAYCGLHFFGRVGAGASSEVTLRVPDKNSHPDGGVCGSVQMPCYLHYQKQYSFALAWKEYTVLFTDLTRSGWPVSFDVSAIYGVEFGLSPNTKFELWIDDISFLNKPAGGVCPKSL